MPTSTLRLHDAQWSHLQEDWRRNWTGLEARAGDLRRSLHDCLRNYFRDTPVPAEMLVQILADYERALREAGPEAGTAAPRLSDFVRNGPHGARLVENASPPGWSQPEQLRERLARGWSAAFAQLAEKVEEKKTGSDPLAAYTRSVLEKRKANPSPPPASIYDACFAPAEDVGRLFGPHYDQFLTGHGITGEEDSAGEGGTAAAQPPPRPLEGELPEWFRAHLHMIRRLEERRNFWTAAARERDAFKYLRAPLRLSPRGFKARMRLFFTGRQRRAEMLRELRERHAWADPPLELLPAERNRWDALYRRRAGCDDDAAKLRAAREALDAALARLDAELQRMSEEEKRLSAWTDPSDGLAELQEPLQAMDQAAELNEDTTNVSAQITERLASVAQTLAQFRPHLR